MEDARARPDGNRPPPAGLLRSAANAALGRAPEASIIALIVLEIGMAPW